MKKIILLIITTLFLSIGCTESEDNSDTKQDAVKGKIQRSETKETSTNVNKDNSVELKTTNSLMNDKPTIHDGEVTLNNGAKWVADKKTTNLVNEIKDKLKKYKADSNLDKDAAVRELKIYVQKLISSYKQKGESQNQFFNWTTKYMRSIVVLSEANNRQQANDALDLIYADMNIYTRNFK